MTNIQINFVELVDKFHNDFREYLSRTHFASLKGINVDVDLLYKIYIKKFPTYNFIGNLCRQAVNVVNIDKLRSKMINTEPRIVVKTYGDPAKPYIYFLDEGIVLRDVQCDENSRITFATEGYGRELSTTDIIDDLTLKLMKQNSSYIDIVLRELLTVITIEEMFAIAKLNIYDYEYHQYNYNDLAQCDEYFNVRIRCNDNKYKHANSIVLQSLSDLLYHQLMISDSTNGTSREYDLLVPFDSNYAECLTDILTYGRIIESDDYVEQIRITNLFALLYEYEIIHIENIVYDIFDHIVGKNRYVILE